MTKHHEYGPLESFSFGDVWKRSDRVCYAFSVRFVFRNKTITKQYSTFKTKKEAKERLAVISSQLYSGQFVFQDNTTVKDFFKMWLINSVYREQQNSAATYELYQYYCDSLFVPAFGKKKIKELSQSDIIKWMQSSDMKNYTMSTVKGALAALKVALKYAKKEGYVASNVAEKMTWPKDIDSEERQSNKKESHFLTLEQAVLLLSNAKQFSSEEKNSDIYPFVLFALTLGLRKSEIRGLKYSDFNFFSGKVRIERQLSSAKRMGLAIDETNPERNSETVLKTKSSYRELHVPKFVMKEIMDMRENYFRNKEKYLDFEDSDYICCSQKGKPRSCSFAFNPYKKLLQESGLPNITIHDLRRTHATLLSKMAVSEKAISMALGHASTRVTTEKYIMFPKSAARESIVLNEIVDKITKGIDDNLIAPATKTIPLENTIKQLKIQDSTIDTILDVSHLKLC